METHLVRGLIRDGRFPGVGDSLGLLRKVRVGAGVAVESLAVAEAERRLLRGAERWLLR